MTDFAKIWVLADDRAGNVGQCLGVAEALGLAFERKDIAYNAFAKLPNGLLGASLIHLSGESKVQIKAPWPDLVIAAGRRTAPVARYIKKQSQGKAKLVQVMHPGRAGARDFDLICVPAHDQRSLADNEMILLGAPHRVNAQKLEDARAIWQGRFKHLAQPRIALIVGGATKDKVFSDEMAADLGRRINQLAKEKGASLLVTTSRRTGAAADALMKEIDVPAYIFKWGDEGDNPYFGYLACADFIVVSGDSVSMCSEACASGKPVYIYAPKDMISAKHQRMVQSLVDQGLATIFNGEIENDRVGPTLNAAEDIAREIKKRFKIA